MKKWKELIDKIKETANGEVYSDYVFASSEELVPYTAELCKKQMDVAMEKVGQEYEPNLVAIYLDDHSWIVGWYAITKGE